MAARKRISGKKFAGSSSVSAALGPTAVPLRLNVNGQVIAAIAEPCLTLLQVLREQLGFTGPKQACDRATCGACTVLADGIRVYACSMLAIDSQDSAITTIESLAADSNLNPLQQAFVDADASQCGYCTSGFVMSAKGFLAENPRPTLEELRKGMCGNLCRCGTYVGVAEAILAVARTAQAERKRG